MVHDMPHTAPGGPAHHDSAHGATLTYWVVGAVLAIVTAVEVLVTFLWLGYFALLFVLLVLAVVKGVLIVSYFMHLKGDAGIFKFAFIAPFVMAVGFFLAMLALFLPDHVGIAG